MCLDFIKMQKMACPKKTKQLTLLDFHSEEIKAGRSGR